MDYWPDVVKEVAVARWLAGHQFPAAQVHEISQPIQVPDHPVTFWRFINSRNGGRSDIEGYSAGRVEVQGDYR
jgi:hypothetical protein